MDPYVMAKASTDQKKAEHVCLGKNLTLTPKSESATWKKQIPNIFFWMKIKMLNNNDGKPQ